MARTSAGMGRLKLTSTAAHWAYSKSVLVLGLSVQPRPQPITVASARRSPLNDKVPAWATVAHTLSRRTIRHLLAKWVIVLTMLKAWFRIDSLIAFSCSRNVWGVVAGLLHLLMATCDMPHLLNPGFPFWPPGFKQYTRTRLFFSFFLFFFFFGAVSFVLFAQRIAGNLTSAASKPRPGGRRLHRAFDTCKWNQQLAVDFLESGWSPSVPGTNRRLRCVSA